MVGIPVLLERIKPYAVGVFVMHRIVGATRARLQRFSLAVGTAKDADAFGLVRARLVRMDRLSRA